MFKIMIVTGTSVSTTPTTTSRCRACPANYSDKPPRAYCPCHSGSTRHAVPSSHSAIAGNAQTVAHRLQYLEDSNGGESFLSF